MATNESRPLMLSTGLRLQVAVAPAEVRAQIAQLVGAKPTDRESVYGVIVELCRLVEPYVDCDAAALEDAIIDSRFADIPVLVSAVSGTFYKTPRGKPKLRKGGQYGG